MACCNLCASEILKSIFSFKWHKRSLLLAHRSKFNGLLVLYYFINIRLNFIVVLRTDY